MVGPAVEAGFRRCLEWDERSPFGSATGRVPEEGRGISWGRSRPRLELPVIPCVLVVPLARMGPRTLASLYLPQIINGDQGIFQAAVCGSSAKRAPSERRQIPGLTLVPPWLSNCRTNLIKRRAPPFPWREGAKVCASKVGDNLLSCKQIWPGPANSWLLPCPDGRGGFAHCERNLG